MVSQCQWGGLRHWVSHIRLDPNSQYLWYTHATFMFLWLHGILCSFPWKPVLKGLKGLKGSCPNPNVFASKQCQACSSHGLYQNLKQAVQTYHDQWFLKFERLSKYVQRYYEIPIRFLYWLEAFEWPCRFPWACSIETNIYIYMIRNRTVVHSSTTETMRSSLRPKPVVLFIRFVVARRSPENS